MTICGASSALKGSLLAALILFTQPYSAVAAKNTLKVVRVIPHSGYSEGLDYRDGFLWHALPKAILKIDPADGQILARYKPATEYSESLVWLNKQLWNVSFSDNGLYRGVPKGDSFVFTRVGSVPEVHAWGLEAKGSELVVTGDYSNKLYFLSAKNGALIRTLVTEGKDLEDLAWDGKGFWSSSFTAHRGMVFRISPTTGKVGPLYSLPDPESCPVIDGIAYDGKHLWITGKECPSIYCVERP